MFHTSHSASIRFKAIPVAIVLNYRTRSWRARKWGLPGSRLRHCSDRRHMDVSSSRSDYRATSSRSTPFPKRHSGSRRLCIRDYEFCEDILFKSNLASKKEEFPFTFWRCTRSAWSSDSTRTLAHSRVRTYPAPRITGLWTRKHSPSGKWIMWRQTGATSRPSSCGKIMWRGEQRWMRPAARWCTPAAGRGTWSLKELQYEFTNLLPRSQYRKFLEFWSCLIIGFDKCIILFEEYYVLPHLAKLYSCCKNL